MTAPFPKLRRLSEGFRDWKCSDPRDHVYTLVNMTTNKTALEPDYSRSVWWLYNGVLLVNRCKDFCDECDKYDEFLQLLSGLVGLGECLMLRDMYE